MNFDNRYLNALNALKDYSFGTLWHVPQEIWNEKRPELTGCNRKWRPGCIVSLQPIDNPCNYALMVMGCSYDRRKGDYLNSVFIVRGITKEHGENHLTFFEKTEKPVGFGMREIGFLDVLDKRKLDPDEMRAAKIFYKETSE